MPALYWPNSTREREFIMIEQRTTAETSTETQDLVERAKALRPLLQKNAATTEDERRVPEENIQAIAEAGLFRITVPRRYGGDEVDIRTKLEVSAALAEGCGSTAWVVTLINVCNWFTSLYPQQAQDDVFGANPNARVAGVFAPSAKTRRVDGGLIVTGKWYYSSGSLHANWGLVGVPVVNEAGVDEAAARSVYPDYTTRARIRAYTGSAIRHIKDAIDILLTAHGAGSFALSSPLQRMWRDSNTAARHAVILPPVSDEVYGKALLGVENTVTPLV
jgi:alkylation response protein AidB-like acyl-CoA dehydrogenase